MDMYELLGKQSPEQLLKEIAAKFKKCRKNKGITQIQLAKNTNVSYGTIKKFEQTGKISLSTLMTLSFYLGMQDDFKLLFNPNKHISYEDFINGHKKH